MFIIIAGFLLILYLVTVEPWLRHYSRQRFFSSFQNDVDARSKMYRHDFYRNFSLGSLVFLIISIGKIAPQQLGLVDISLTQFNAWPMWLQLVTAVIFLWFVFYFFFFVTIGVRLHSSFRAHLIKKIKPVAITAPQTKTEYAWWTANSLMSVAEELVYRGFMFFYIALIYPTASLWIIGAVSVVIESIRYAPRFAAMKYVAQRAVVFALVFIAFNSLYAVIVIHIIYSLRIMAVPFHWAREEKATVVV